jgi:hypothetical protein
MNAEGNPMEADAGEPSNNPAPIRLKRRLNVNISGTLSNFSLAGRTGASWKPTEGKQVDIFGVQNHEGICLDHASMTNALRNAVIRKVVVLETKNTFPIPWGVSMSCVTPEEVTDNGDKYVCTVMPESTNTNPLTVFETDSNSNESIEWRNRYPSYNASNLDSWGVLQVQRCPFLFVNMDHPVIALLRANKDMLGADIDQMPKIDEQWFKVSKQVFKTCCSTLRTRVLSRVATRDLNTFSVQLHTLNNADYTHVDAHHALANFQVNPEWEDKDIEKYTRAHMTKVLSTPYTYMSRIEVEYEIQP